MMLMPPIIMRAGNDNIKPIVLINQSFNYPMNNVNLARLIRINYFLKPVKCIET